MRRAARITTWAVLLVLAAGVAAYVLLLVARGISPPVVPVAAGNDLPGLATGDAVVLREVAAGDVEPGEVLAVRLDGVALGRVVSSDNEGSTVSYQLAGTGHDDLVETTHREVLGARDAVVPVAGYPLLALRNRVVQLVLAVAVVALATALLLGRRTPLDLLVGDDADPSEPALAALPPAPHGAAPVTPHFAVTYRGPPMSISPDDLRNVRFALTRKGYDTEAVDRTLDTVAAAMEGILAERQQLVERVRALEASLAQAQSQQSQAQSQAVPGAATGGASMDDLLGEARAIRSLLQALVVRSAGPGARPGG